MRRRRKVGETRRLAGKPGPRLGEMTEIGEMIAQVLVAGPDRRGVGRAAVRTVAAIDLLLDEIGSDLVVKLAMKPVDEPARFGAWQGLARK